jgi:hypothetical protein
MEVVGEFMGIDEDKAIWEFFKTHYLHFFPKIPSRTSFTRQAANLWKYKQLLQKKITERLGALNDETHIIDSFPIPVCKLARASRNKLFKGEANTGYCATKQEYYFGFKGHLSISLNGAISAYVFSKASIDDREAVYELTEGMSKLVIGDKGYIKDDLKKEMRGKGIELETPLKDNMVDTRPKELVKLLKKVRRKVETVLGQLVERFHIENVWARDMWHFTSRLFRKLLAHTVAFWLNRNSEHPLQFDNLISY